MNSTDDISTTKWTAIWALFLAGCTLALHVGKLPAALPLLVDEFGLSLAQSGNLVSIYSLLIAVLALAAGLAVARIGYVRFAVAGVTLGMLGSIAGLTADSLLGLMLSRACEGLGWVIGVVSFPTILACLCTARDRPVVLGLWGAFMGVGTGFILLTAPTLQSMGGWRLSWLVASLLSLIGALVVIVVCYQQRVHLLHLRNNRVRAKFADFRSKEAIALCVVFCVYSLQYTSITSFLPTLLSEDPDMLLSNATYWTALLILINAFGNISAGWLLRQGISRFSILSTALVVTGVLALIILSSKDATLRIIAAFPLTLVGGLIPGTLFSTAPLVASSAAGVGGMIGFMLMGAGLGQMIGPIAVTRVVEWAGDWFAGGALLLAAGIVGAVCATWLRRLP